MKIKTLLVNVFIVLAILSACGGQINQGQSAQTCADIKSVVEAFYAANDAAQYTQSLQYVTDDVAIITWADGANGYHMNMRSVVGNTHIQSFLEKPGLKRTSNGPNLPNYTMQEIQISEGKMSFKLLPDRLHPNKRPYNPYDVEVFFSGCKIELIKVVERVTWL